MATTPNYSFSVYSSTDTDVRFLDFRVATAGSQSTSNFYVIDTVLKQHSDAIDSINATPSAFVVKGTYSAGSLYTASVANYPGYKNEQLIVLSLNQKNTGAVQININGTTNKDVMKYGSDGVLKAVDAGDFVANSPVLCLYDGTRFVVIGITSASSITVTGETGDILQIADDGTIESSGKKAAQPNGIATLDENGNVVQVANMANSAAAVYDGEPVSVEYVGQNRIASITAYGETPQGGTTEAPVALTGVENVFVGGRNLLPKATKRQTIYGVTFSPNSNGSITVHGTATGGIATYNFADGLDRAMLDQTVFVSGAIQLVKVIINEKTAEGAFARNVIVDMGQGASGILTRQKDSNILYATLQVQNGDTVNHAIYPMLNLGSTAMPYEPYQGSVTTLPIPRPLRKVGDVGDVCRTRVKGVYDKRIVLDGTENWNISSSKPNSFITPVSERIVNGLSDSYPTLKSPEIGTKNGIYLNYTEDIIVTDLACSTVEEFKAHLSAHPLTVYYWSTAYDGTNGLDVCLMKYQTGFVELDGTENWSWNTSLAWAYIAFFLPNNKTGVAPVCSHYQGTGAFPAASQVGINELGSLIIKDPSWQSVEDAKAYLAAQKAAGTPVQVAYQLATPEVYATDPVDFDNTAGPLTVVTGGQVEVKMTDFVTDRTPAFLNKLDKNGDGSNVTAAFTEATQDADIVSGETLSTLFGKIKKRFSVLASAVMLKSVFALVGNPNLLDNSDLVWRVNQRGVSGTITTAGYFIDRWKLVSGSVTLSADGLQLAAGTVIAQILEYAAGTDVIASLGIASGTASAAYDNATKTYTITATTACTLIWAKLEKGSIATPYVPKGYGAELAECLRYYQEIAFSVGQDRATYKYIPTLIPMRINPTYTLQQIAASGTPTVTTTQFYITANLGAPQYFDGFARLSADL